MMTAILEENTLAEGSLLLSGISWAQFLDIETVFAEVAEIRFDYLDGMLEIMPVREEHEDLKSTIGILLEVYLREIGKRFYVRGNPTLGDKSLGARKEPDESYNFGSKKLIPDLAIKVILTSGGIDKLEIYQRIGMPEVWFWQDGNLTIYTLNSAANRSYERINQSQQLPDLDISLLVRFINLEDQYDAAIAFTNHLRDIENI